LALTAFDDGESISIINKAGDQSNPLDWTMWELYIEKAFILNLLKNLKLRDEASFGLQVIKYKEAGKKLYESQ